MTVQRLGIASVLAAMVLGVVGVPASAVAQQGWVSCGFALSTSGASNPRIAFDAAGNGFAVWEQFDGVASAVLLARFDPSGFDPSTGCFGFPGQTLSPPGQDTLSPDVAVDGAGNAVVAWIREAGAVYHVQGLTYSATTQTWSAPVDLATVGLGGAGPDIAVTPGGDAVVVWTAVTSAAPLAVSVHAARFVAATGTWTAATQVSTPGQNAYLARVAVAPDGDAVAAWSKEESATTESVQAARFVATSGTWQAPHTLSPAASFAELATVAIDTTGNAVVAWQRTSAIEVARYDAGTNAWSPAATVSTGPAANGPGLAGDAEGNVTAVWRLGSGVVETTRYDAVLAAWSATQPIAGASGIGRPAVAADPAGNLVAFWPSLASGGSGQGARYVRATGLWTAVTTLGTFGAPELVAMAADGVGNVGVISQSSGTAPFVYVTRWSGAPTAPSITSAVGTTAGVTVHVTPPVVTEAAFTPTAYEYSISIRPWVRVPLSSPIVIPPGLPVGQWSIMVRAVNAAGAGPWDQRPFAIPPDPPSHLAVVAVTGNQVTLAWELPAGATSDFTTYVVEGGLAPGQVLASLPTGSPVPAFTFAAPSGVFHVRVRTVAFQFRSAPSNEVILAVNVVAPPSAPSSLLGLANGSAVALAWTNTFAGGAPAAVSLVVNGPVSGVVPLSLTDTFQFAGVPPGTYTFQVVATNAAGSSPPSNAVSLTFPATCSGAPDPPRRLVVNRTGRTLSVAWSPPDTGVAVTSYVLLVSGAFSGAFPLTARDISAPVPPGAYTFRVQAANPCGASAPTTSVTVVVP